MTTLDIALSPDQQQAKDAVLASLAEGKETVLVGPAGSGKTTLTKAIIAASPRKAVLGCPTGKAAQRLSQVNGWRASTIHKLLYGSMTELRTGGLEFGDPHAPCKPNELLIIDEASMLGQKVYNELMSWVPPGAQVLFVGDREQLEPVKDTWGPDLKNPTAALTQVHRQAAGNPIIAYATAVRTGQGDAWLANEWDPADDRITVQEGGSTALTWYLDRRAAGRDVTLITYTHGTRKLFNNAVRSQLGFRGPICPGDRLLIRANNYAMGLMNGQVVTVQSVAGRSDVKEVHIEEHADPIVVNTELIEESPREFWAWRRLRRQTRNDQRIYRCTHVWYGNCLTVHSSQGSQWDEVGFLWGKHFTRMRAQKKREAEAKRFLYTAITRAAEKLGIFAL